MSVLNIVAEFMIKPEFQAEFKAEVKKVVDGSRKEAGCIQYDLNQDVKDPNTFIFIESWQSQEAITFHNTTDHFKNFAKFCEGKVVKKVVHIVRQIV